MATSDQITDGKAFILSVINSTENLSVNMSDVTFGPPVKPTGALPLRNTRVIITPKSYSGYYGVKTVWYNRIHINQLGTIKVEKGVATHVVQLIPAINEKYGVFLTDDDIVDEVLPVFQTGEITVNLQISPNSYMFYSGDVIITQDFDPGVSGFNLIPSVWDTDYKSTLITNSSELNSLQVINSDPGISMIRTNNSFETGKRYFEFSMPSDNGVIGLATASAGMDVLIGSDQNSFGIYPFEGVIRHNGQVVYTTNQLPLFGNRTIGVMVDLDNATLGFILQGNIRVDIPNLILPTAPLYVVVGNSSETKLLNNQLTNFGQIPFKYTVPVGYVAGFGIGGSPVVPTAGALIRTKCVGYNKVGIYANGTGGTYSDVIESDSAECGYGMTTPTPTTSELPTTSVTPTPTQTNTSTPSNTGSTPSPTITETPTPSVTSTESPTPTDTSSPTETSSTTLLTTAAPTPTPTQAPIILGLNWATTDVTTGNNIVGVIYNEIEGIWITVSSIGIINTSTDLLTFTTNTSLQDKMADMIINDPVASSLYPDTITGDVLKLIDGIYFISGTIGWLYTSTDLITWNAVNIYDKYGQSYGYDPTTTVVKINNEYVAAIKYGSGSIGFISSTDGVTWNQYSNYLSATLLDDGLSLDKIVNIDGSYYANTINYPMLFRSTDGINWTIDTAATGNVKAIASSGTRLVTVLNNNYQTAYSDDNGVTWTIDTGLQSVGWENQNNNNDTQIQNIVYADGRFVVVGSIINTIIGATSTDGLTWTKSEDLGNYDLMDYEVTRVVYGNNKLVLSSGKKKLAVSPYIVPPTTTTTVAPTTTEAPTTTATPTPTTTTINLNLTWTTTAIPMEGYSKIVRMFYDAGKYVVINNGAGITTSDNDFSTVTVITTLRDKINEVLPGLLDNSFELQKYVPFFENGYYCVLSNNGWLFTSNDLATWNAINVNDIVGYTFGNFGGSVYCPSIGKQLVFCIDGSVIASSDYINWVTYTDSNIDQFFSFTTMRKAIKLNNYYYAYSWNETGSYSESFTRSSDGITWEALTDLNTKILDALGNTSGYLSLTSNGSRLVMLLGTAYLTAHSDDNGITWTVDWNLQSLGWDANLTTSKTLLASIEYIDGRFVAVGGKQPNPWLAFSLDGITWERHTAIEASNILAPQYTSYDAIDVITSGVDKYLVYANYGKIATSFAVNLVTSTPTPTPTFPLAGTILNTSCQGFDKVGTIADGSGGSYSELIEANSPECGYGTTTTTPAPTTIGGDLGVIWTTTDINIGTRTEGIVYNSTDNIWVTFSKQGQIATSSDLVTFTESLTLQDKMAYLAINDPISTNFYPNEISHNFIELIDGIYFVPGNNGWLYTSTDLITWNAVNIYDKYGQTTGELLGDKLLTTVVKIGTNYVAALRYTESIGFISSTDGITWGTYSNGLSAFLLSDTLSLDKIYNLNGKYFATTINYPMIFSSVDGSTWTFYTDAGSNVKSMASNGTRIVSLLLNQYRTAHSDDNGVTWTVGTDLQSMGWTGQDNGGVTKLVKLIYAGDRFVAVGVLNGVVICATSADGLTWTRSTAIEQLSITDSNYDGWEGTKVVYANNKLIVVAGANHILAISP